MQHQHRMKFPTIVIRRLVKKILKTGPPMPINFNLYNRPWWLTKSKAEPKSSETARLLKENCRLCVCNRRAKALSEAKLSIRQNF